MSKRLEVGAEIVTTNQKWRVEGHLRDNLYFCTIAARKEYPAALSLVPYDEPEAPKPAPKPQTKAPKKKAKKK